MYFSSDLVGKYQCSNFYKRMKITYICFNEILCKDMEKLISCWIICWKIDKVSNETFKINFYVSKLSSIDSNCRKQTEITIFQIIKTIKNTWQNLEKSNFLINTSLKILPHSNSKQKYQHIFKYFTKGCQQFNKIYEPKKSINIYLWEYPINKNKSSLNFAFVLSG